MNTLLLVTLWSAGLIAVLALAYTVQGLIVQPSLERDWAEEQAVLARAEISGESVTVRDIRNFNYRSTTDYDMQYYDKTFDFEKLESAWYIVVPFPGIASSSAHTMVSFGFEGGEYITISPEIRRETHEAYSPFKGLFRQYELVYIIADERDVVKLRSNHRLNDVYMYPVQATREQIQQAFVSMLQRANKLATEPEFYNTLTNSCSTNVVAHVNQITPGRVPLSYKVVLPAFSDALAQDLGLIDNALSIEELRVAHNISQKARQFADDPNFSQRIRE